MRVKTNQGILDLNRDALYIDHEGVLLKYERLEWDKYFMFVYADAGKNTPYILLTLIDLDKWGIRHLNKLEQVLFE